MNNKKNLEIKMELLRQGVRQYELAQALGVSEFTVCRWLHSELSPDRKENMLKTIRRLGGENGTEKKRIQS